MSKAEHPQAGQWYRNEEGTHRWFFIGQDSSGCWVVDRFRVSQKYCDELDLPLGRMGLGMLSESAIEKMVHLPDCDAWDWEPDPTEEDYFAAQGQCGIEVGDWVRVERSAETGEQGWKVYWNPKMDSHIGGEYRVSYCTVFGVVLDLRDSERSFYFPYFVLSKVDPPESKPAEEIECMWGVRPTDSPNEAWDVQYGTHIQIEQSFGPEFISRKLS